LEVQRLQDDVLPKLARAEAAAERAYRGGAATPLEWSQRLSEHTAARRQQLEAALDAQRALIEIQRLTGQPFGAGANVQPMREVVAATVALTTLLAACGTRQASDEHGHAEANDHGHAQEDEVRKGEHGGRWLEQDGHAVELAIAEDGTPPKFQAWLYRDGKPLPATAGTVNVHLVRLGDVTEDHRLVPRADGSLLADSVVGEPHSFDVEVRATIGAQALRWTWPSYEGRTRIAPGIAQASGIRVQPAGAGVIADAHEVQGLLTPVEGRVASVTARFPGPIRKLGANVGDRVRAGQVLATIESNL